MTPEQQLYMNAINAHVAAYKKPEVVSVAEDAHVFHFERGGDWRDGLVALVNKNGHHFRIFKQASGTWMFAKTWNDIFATQPWMTEAKLTRADPEELIQLCGTGPQGKATAELLSLLPKGASERRKAVWRDKILDVRFDVDNNRFSIFPGIDGLSVQTYSGKIWESHDAARWCHAHLSTPVTVQSGRKTPMTAHQAAVDAQVMADLEASSMWGMF